MVRAVRVFRVVVALLPAGLGGQPADAPRVFLTVPQANLQGRPSDASEASLSATGRYVAFTSFARLAAQDTNECSDIYVLDRVTANVTIESLTPDGQASGRASSRPYLSGDGRFLIYETVIDAVDGGDSPRRTIILRDRLTGVTHPLDRRGEAPAGGSRNGAISADGRIAVFDSSSTNLVDGPDANGSGDDVYSVDIGSMTIRRVSLDAAGRQSPAGSSFDPAVSADGRYIAFSSTAPLDGNSGPSVVPRGRSQVEIYLRDTTLGLTTCISVSAGRSAPNASSYDAAISGDGRYVAFVSDATNLVRHDNNRAADVFLRDTRTGTIRLVSRGESGGSANGPSGHPAMSADGSVVTFQSDASDLACGRRCATAVRDINLVADVFTFDRASGAVRRVSTGRTPWMEASIGPAVDGTGTVIAFSSRHPLDARDDRDDYDLFVWGPGR